MNQDEIEIWTRLNKCECVKKVKGYWLPRDYCLEESGAITNYYSCGEIDPIWIPPLYDSIMPERSLIGIYKSLPTSLSMRWNLGSFLFFNRPDLALAKAIIEQEGT